MIFLCAVEAKRLPSFHPLALAAHLIFFKFTQKQSFLCRFLSRRSLRERADRGVLSQERKLGLPAIIRERPLNTQSTDTCLLLTHGEWERGQGNWPFAAAWCPPNSLSSLSYSAALVERELLPVDHLVRPQRTALVQRSASHRKTQAVGSLPWQSTLGAMIASLRSPVRASSVATPGRGVPEGSLMRIFSCVAQTQALLQHPRPSQLPTGQVQKSVHKPVGSLWTLLVEDKVF